MPNKALVLVAAAVLEAREKPSTYSSRRPGRHVPTIVDQLVSFTIATDDVIETVPPQGARMFSDVPEVRKQCDRL